MHALGRQAPVGGLLLEVLLNRGPVLQGYLESVTLIEFAADGGRVAYPRIVADFTGTVGGEVAEVRRCRCPPLALGRLIIDVERTVGVLKDHRLQAFRGRHDGIVLGAPVDEVAAIGGSKQRCAVVHLKHQAPRAVAGPADRRVVHLFLCAPCAVVRRAELAGLAPGVVFLYGDVQSARLARRVYEYSLKAVGLSPCSYRAECREHRRQ